MLRAYVDPIPAHLSLSIHRLAAALTRYAPADIQIVTDRTQADLLLCHVIGPEGWAPYLEEFAAPKRYAIWQHCFRVTNHGRAADWAPMWQGAALVASCYDLAGAWANERPRPGDAMIASDYRSPNFIRLPLGVDTDVFRPDPTMASPNHRAYLVATSGYVAGTESVGEWGRVCEARGRAQFHLGPDLTELAHTRVARQGISDAVLADWYSRCAFVSGLRRVEGFELPAYEGLACGARPVMFDREDARHWLDGHAYFVPECDPTDLVMRLVDIVDADPLGAVRASEIDWVKETFSWATMATKFWAAISR